MSKALAVGVAVLATEAGLSWLRRRIGAEDRSSVPAVRGLGSASRVHLVRQSLEEVLVQTWEDPHSRVLARREVRSFFTTRPTGRQRKYAPSLPLDRPIAPIGPKVVVVKRLDKPKE